MTPFKCLELQPGDPAYVPPFRKASERTALLDLALEALGRNDLDTVKRCINRLQEPIPGKDKP